MPLDGANVEDIVIPGGMAAGAPPETTNDKLVAPGGETTTPCSSHAHLTRTTSTLSEGSVNVFDYVQGLPEDAIAELEHGMSTARAVPLDDPAAGGPPIPRSSRPRTSTPMLPGLTPTTPRSPRAGLASPRGGGQEGGRAASRISASSHGIHHPPMTPRGAAHEFSIARVMKPHQALLGLPSAKSATRVEGDPQPSASSSALPPAVVSGQNAFPAGRRSSRSSVPGGGRASTAQPPGVRAVASESLVFGASGGEVGGGGRRRVVRFSSTTGNFHHRGQPGHTSPRRHSTGGTPDLPTVRSLKTKMLRHRISVEGHREKLANEAVAKDMRAREKEAYKGVRARYLTLHENAVAEAEVAAALASADAAARAAELIAAGDLSVDFVHMSKRAASKKMAEVAEVLDSFRPGTWKTERWRRMWHDDVATRRKLEARRISNQTRSDREWIESRREHLQGRLREWDGEYERDTRELRNQMAKRDLELELWGEEEPRARVAGAKAWKNELRGGGGTNVALVHHVLGYSIGSEPVH